jgi:two-component system, OmpR family, response regulator QseB
VRVFQPPFSSTIATRCTLCTMHLLLVEDDLDLGTSLQQALRGAGCTSEWLRTAADAQRFAASQRYDCVLLDLGLPDGHGLALLRQWRAQGLATPLIVITASEALGDRLAGLDEGADDFLVKPFAVEELISRLRAVTRRAARQAASSWVLGGLTLDVPRRQCTVDGVPVTLSPREFDVLVVLARADGAVVAKHRLAQALAPLGEALDFNAIEVRVHNLRRKVGAARVQTVRGVGYRLAHVEA